MEKPKSNLHPAMNRFSRKEVLSVSAFTILCIVCFPTNPLVLTGVIETSFRLPLFILGWVIWAFGMVLVMAPVIVFPRQGEVLRGKSFVNTTRLVDTGIYAVVRHPQYTGGIYAIFATTLLWYPHWLFAVLGVIGAMLIYLSTIEEDRRLIEKFGKDYVSYMKKVPRMNIFLGVIWVLRRRQRRYDGTGVNPDE